MVAITQQALCRAHVARAQNALRRRHAHLLAAPLRVAAVEAPPVTASSTAAAGTRLQLVDGKFVDERWTNGRWDLSQFAVRHVFDGSCWGARCTSQCDADVLA